MNAFSEFPSLHPLIVHFPIVCLILAPIFQAAGLYSRRSDWLSGAALLALGGLATALLAARVFHAEPIGPSPAVRTVFERHELFADLTIWVAAATVVSKVAARWTVRLRNQIELGALALMVIALVLVSVAGHLGAELTHIHNVKAE